MALRYLLELLIGGLHPEDGMLNAEAKWLMNGWGSPFFLESRLSEPSLSLTGVYEGNLNDYNTWEPERGSNA